MTWGGDCAKNGGPCSCSLLSSGATAGKEEAGLEDCRAWAVLLLEAIMDLIWCLFFLF